VASIICQVLGRGVTRSKRRAIQWLRKSAQHGNAGACLQLAMRMYGDEPYAREVGHVVEATGVTTSAGVMEGHSVPPDVLTGVVHWLRKGSATGQYTLPGVLEGFRREVLEGHTYCFNDGCEVVGHLKDFKVCPQCKTVRYCGDACQKQDWNAGGHKDKCGTSAPH
jgi:TPR repeat protein